MKKSRFTQEQVITILKEVEAGSAVRDVCRHHGISEWTFYQWRAKYAGVGLPEARRLKELEDENRKLKRLVADQALDNLVLKEALTKKW